MSLPRLTIFYLFDIATKSQQMIRYNFMLISALFFLINSNSAKAQFKQDTSKRINYAAIPIINYDPQLGLNLGFMAQMYYKVNPNDTISPSSATGMFGMYTTNKTHFLALFQQLYLKEDTWRFMLAAGTGAMNFQFWQDIPTMGGQFIDFSTDALFVMVRPEREIYKKLYGGISLVYAEVKTTFDVPDWVPDSLKYDERNMNSLGYLFNYDVREHQLNPYGGYNIEFKNNFYREWMNNTDNFDKYELTYNHYYPIRNKKTHILATRIKANIAAGDVPFQGQNIVGRDDIRGYTSGKHRDNQIYTMQAEYRWRFYKKFGMVGFFGLASAVEKAGDIFNSELLPGAGVGFRYMMIPKEPINIGFDIAKGKNDWGLYFRIGETFGR